MPSCRLPSNSMCYAARFGPVGRGLRTRRATMDSAAGTPTLQNVAAPSPAPKRTGTTPQLLPNHTRRARVQGLPSNSSYGRAANYCFGQGARASRPSRPKPIGRMPMRHPNDLVHGRSARMVFRKTGETPVPPGLCRPNNSQTTTATRVRGLPRSSHPWPTPKEKHDPKSLRKLLPDKNQMATPRREPAPSSPAPKRLFPDRASRSNCHHRNLGRVELPSSGGNESSRRIGQVHVKSPFHGCCDPALCQ